MRSRLPSDMRPGTRAGPDDAGPVLVLGFAGLIWVVVHHFRDHLGLALEHSSGLVAKGYIGASLYFIATGYLLARRHAQGRQNLNGRYRTVLWTWLSEVYPLHLAALALMAVLFAIARLVGVPDGRQAFDLADIPANLLLVQAWGVLDADRWNFPSWLVSAEWFGLLAYPLTARLAFRTSPNAAATVILAVLLFGAMFALAARYGVLFTDMSVQIGALETVPAFLLGTGLYRLGSDRDLARPTALALMGASALWIVSAAMLRLSDLVIWPALGLLTYAVSETHKRSTACRACGLLSRLSTLSYPMLLLYLPVDIVYFRLARRLFPHPDGVIAWGIWLGVFPTLLLVAWTAYILWQRPWSRWLRSHSPFRAPETAPQP